MAAPPSSNEDRVKGPWTPEEDNQLRLMVQRFGPKNWAGIAERVPGRTGKSCRLRWFNQLSPKVSRRPFTADEDAKIIAAHAQYGNKWSIIARKLPGRTDNSVKNRWNSTLRRRGFTVGAPNDYNAPQVSDTPVIHSASPASSYGSEPSRLQYEEGCRILESNPIQSFDQEPFAQFHEQENAFSLSQPSEHKWPGETSTQGVRSFRAFNGDLNVNLFQRDPPPPTPLPQSPPPLPEQPLSEPDAYEWPGESSTQGVGSFRAFNGGLNVNLFQRDPPPPTSLPQPLPPPPQQPAAPPAAAMIQRGGVLFNRLITKEGARGLMISALTNKIKKLAEHKRMLIGGVRSTNFDENQTEAIANYIMCLAGINGADH